MSAVKVRSRLTARRPVRARRVVVEDSPAQMRGDRLNSVAFTIATAMIPVAVGALIFAAVVTS